MVDGLQTCLSVKNVCDVFVAFCATDVDAQLLFLVIEKIVVTVEFVDPPDDLRGGTGLAHSAVDFLGDGRCVS